MMRRLDCKWQGIGWATRAAISVGLLVLFVCCGCSESYRHNPLRGWALRESVTFENPAGVEEVWRVIDYALLSFKVEQVHFVERGGFREYTAQVRFRLFDPPSRQSIIVTGAYTYRDGARKQWELRKTGWFPLEVELHGKWKRSPFRQWLQQLTLQWDGKEWQLKDYRLGDLELGETEMVAALDDGRKRYRKSAHFSLTDAKTRERTLVTGDLYFQDGTPAPWELEWVEFVTKGVVEIDAK